MDMLRNQSRRDGGQTSATDSRPWPQAGGAGSPEILASGDTALSRVGPPTSATLAELPGVPPPATARPAERQEGASVIAAGATWRGSLRVEGSVRIEGQVAGEVQAGDTVHVAEGAQVHARVTASSLVIAGSFQGQASGSERIELLPTSRIEGELTAKTLTVHEGALVDGLLVMIEPSESSRGMTAG